MVACLERTEENTAFHQIVDFLFTCSINYALTVSPTIYASYIEQFWNIDTFKIVNSVKQIHAIVDGKAVVISESSVRSDLLFNDEDGITCLTNDEIFANLALMGYEQLSTKLTFQKEPQIESLQIETPPPATSQTEAHQTAVTQIVFHEAHIKQILPSPTTYQRKRKTQKHRRTKKDTELPQTSVPQDLGADEAIHKEGVTGIDTGGSPRRQETMGGTHAQTRSGRVLEQPNEPPLSEGHTSGSGEGRMEQTFELMDSVPTTSHDSPLTGGYTPGSDEGRLKLEELMAMCTKLSQQVLELEKEKEAQAVEILNLKKRVESFDGDLDEEDASKQGRKSDKMKPMFKDSDFDRIDDHMENVEGETIDAATTGVSIVSAPVTTTGVTISTAEPRTPPTTTIVFDDNEDLTIAQTLVKMKSEKAKEKGIAFRDEEETHRLIRSITTLQPLPSIDPKDKGNGVLVEEELEKPEKVKRKDQGLAQIESNAELAQRLHEEELAELERAQIKRQKQEEATNAALAEEFDEIQARIDVDHELTVRLTRKEQRKYIIKERARLLADYFERRKKQLATERAEAIRNKPPTRTQFRNRMITYLKHIEESSKKQKLEEENDAEKEELRASMDVVPRDDVTIDVESLATKYTIDVIDLYSLVKERYETTSPEGYGLLLCGDLKTLFEPNKEDEIWKNQQSYNLMSWRLFDSCGVHILLMDTEIAIHMMIEKKYPLTQEFLSRMLNRRLEVNHESEMAFELLGFTRSQLQKQKSVWIHPPHDQDAYTEET
ncbi:hypothetical protein Tco_0677482 [Tanacetum coccineum]|uniref:Uncharacterized protein n=1 Tax=Tanacetum coccineum TaxID=301880 RepID=A0ABQ4XD71_9ASTR